MALEYAYRYGANYIAVLWVRADSLASLVSSFVELAHVLNLPERNERDQNVVVDAVRRWLRLHTGWLLIFDNMDNPSIAESFLPKAGPGHLLFTTRAQALSGIAQCMEVRPMKAEIGALLLLRRSEMLPLQASLEQAALDNRTVAGEISDEMDGLPLALDQAGAYIKAEACSLQDYLSLYRTRRQNLLQSRKNLDQQYPYSVATTWNISFGKVQSANPAAAELLNFCAFLAPDAIPETIIIKGAPYLGDVLGQVATNPVELDLICGEVLKYSLIQREGDTKTLTIHRLVQAVLQDNLPADAQRQWMQRTVMAVDEADDMEHWDASELWLPHAMMCAKWIEQEAFSSEGSAHLLHQSGYYLSNRARHREAEPFCSQALSMNERLFGPEHPNTTISLNNLADLYRLQGQFAKAEPLLKRSLGNKLKVFGNSHPDTAISIGNLGQLYHDQGKFGEAELLYKRALEICEQEVGPQHLRTATGLNHLAMLYLDQGRFAEAEPLLERSLATREQQLEPTHPDVGQNLSNLAELYRMRGKFGEAERLLRRALTIYEQRLGAANAATMVIRSNLAALYWDQGRFVEAASVLEPALAACERELGPQHPQTATVIGNLASLYHDQGKLAEAELLYKRALAIFEQGLGPGHPGTVTTLNNLATLYIVQGRFAEAEPLLKQALASRERLLEPTHPDIAQSLNNLAELYRIQGKFALSEPLYKRALAIFEQDLGLEHPDTAKQLNNLALLYHNQGKFAQAEPLYKRALAISEHVFGRDHPAIQTLRANYDALLQEMGRRERKGL